MLTKLITNVCPRKFLLVIIFTGEVLHVLALTNLIWPNHKVSWGLSEDYFRLFKVKIIQYFFKTIFKLLLSIITSMIISRQLSSTQLGTTRLKSCPLFYCCIIFKLKKIFFRSKFFILKFFLSYKRFWTHITLMLFCFCFNCCSCNWDC